MAEDLLLKVSEMVGLVPPDTECNIRREKMTMQSFLLANDAVLKDLGFPLGDRLILLDWIQQQTAAKLHSVPGPSSVVNTSTNDREPRPASSAVSNPINSPAASAGDDTLPFYPVEDVLSMYNKGSIKGTELIATLKQPANITRQERIFIVKVLGKYLMKNSMKIDQPSKQEKMRMAESIVKAFPVLAGKDGAGYELFFDPVARTGYLEHFIRQRRSRSCDIQTLWVHGKKSVFDEEPMEQTREKEAVLRERRPNGTNADELLEMMRDTRAVRRAWIAKDSPTISQILYRYPRFQDLNSAIKEEFAAIHPTCDHRLCDEWPRCRESILHLTSKLPVNTDLQAMLSALTDSDDEEAKTVISFRVLPFLLPAPPKRGVKKQRLSPAAVADLLFSDIKDDVTLDEAVKQLTDRGIVQPVLLRLQNRYFVKTDHTAIPIFSAACFADCVEFLFMCYYVFHSEYPHELRLIFGLIEKLLHIPTSIGKSSTLSSLLASL